MKKPEQEFFRADSVPWTSPEPGVPGQHERILSVCEETGVATRLLRFEPGCDTSSLGVVTHGFWEEVYILEGNLYDLSLDEDFTAGMYACRPPGMPHGPWRTTTGCLTFEVRYP